MFAYFSKLDLARKYLLFILKPSLWKMEHIYAIDEGLAG
jgi:hypothetical protein